MQKAYEDVVLFQTYCGKLDNPATKLDLMNQVRLIVEEAKELYEAIEKDEGQEQILKETCDNLVVLFGMVAMLQRSGYRVGEAMQAVCDNNLSKFSATQTEAFYTKMGYESTDPAQVFEVKQLDWHTWGCFNGDHKLMKPIGYLPCLVKNFTPSGNK